MKKLHWKQWLGVSFGFIGAILVIGFDIGKSITIARKLL